MNRYAATAVGLVLATGATAEPVKFEYWYGLGGYLGEQVAETCNRFNAAQDQFEIVCVGQGSYEAAVQNTIAAFRAGQHPTIVQAFDAGTTDLMLSGEFYPVYQLMEDFEIDIDWDNYFPGIKNYYATSDGRVVSMPFNSSTPLMYYNIDLLAQGGVNTPPETWEEFEASLVAMKEAGVETPFCYAPSTWIDLEQFSMVHNVPIATNANGYEGLDAELTFNQTVHVRHMENLVRWVNEGLAAIRTNQSGMNARDAFGAGQCGY
jgi:sn-glycerol 3-phosphate transport system substrate-binding protein